MRCWSKSLLLAPVMSCVLASAQVRNSALTVVDRGSIPVRDIPQKIQAIVPLEGMPDGIESRTISFYSRTVPVEIMGAKGLLAWFSYTHPPKQKMMVSVEADQPTFGSVLYNRKLYVCPQQSPSASIPVMNRLIASLGTESITDGDAISLALAMAKCSSTLYIFADPQGASKEGDDRMRSVASPPKVKRVKGNVQVEFYSWAPLPQGEMSRWLITFEEKAVREILRVPISSTAPR